MPISADLKERSQGVCELCNEHPVSIACTVSPETDDSPDHQVALCTECHEAMNKEGNGFYWRFLEGSIWSPEASVQALSYRLLHQYRDESWAADILASVEPEEEVVRWALSAFDVAEVHRDAFGNVLENGDNVVLTQALDVKGTNFTASKGTVVRKIRLVHDNTEQIEGKINEQQIVILTKFVKKS